MIVQCAQGRVYIMQYMVVWCDAAPAHGGVKSTVYL